MRVVHRNPAYDKNEKLYRVWSGMKTRCSNPNHPRYKYYGGKGISVCREWAENYQAFRDWSYANGYKEIAGCKHGDQMSIERIDNSKGYNPDNCTYIPLKDQCLNKSHRKAVFKLKVKSNVKHDSVCRGLMKCQRNALSQAEREICDLYMGGKTLIEIAQIRGVSRQRIQQITSRIISRAQGAPVGRTRYAEYNGVKKSIHEWSEELSIPYRRIVYLMDKHGLSFSEAIQLPTGKNLQSKEMAQKKAERQARIQAKQEAKSTKLQSSAQPQKRATPVKPNIHIVATSAPTPSEWWRQPTWNR